MRAPAGAACGAGAAAHAPRPALINWPRDRTGGKTRYDPSEVEPRIARGGWVGAVPSRARGRRGRELLDRDSASERDRVAAHGARAQDSIQDCLIRYHRMRGQRTKWILGTDHAGIATQTQVEQRARRARAPAARSSAARRSIERVWRWREEYGGTIIEQLKRLGASCDYDDERFTLDDGYAAAVLHVFVDLYEKGYIYRDRYMVNWDPGSAVGDLRSRGRGPRGHRHPLLHRLSARRRARAQSRSPQSGPRRCSPTPRSLSTPTTSATAG